MEALRQALSSMISISEEELAALLAMTALRQYRKGQWLSRAGEVPQEVFFVVKGLLRAVITDGEGTEHTLHFALENQFIADYSSFMQEQPAYKGLQALEDTEVVVLPRTGIAWGYAHLAEGQKLGRLIAEYYFIYMDNRIRNQYARTAKERYDSITEVFPNIHNRVPQHMIASYLGITPVHLSRLKKADLYKV